MDYDEWAEAERDRLSCEDFEFEAAWEEQFKRVRLELCEEFNHLILSGEEEPTIEVVDLLMSGPVIRTEKLRNVVTDLVVLPEVAQALMIALRYPWNKGLREAFCNAYLDANSDHIAKIRGLPTNDL